MSKIADADAVSESRNSSMLQQYWQQVEQNLASPLWKGGHVKHVSFRAANNGCEADNDERPNSASKLSISDTRRRLVSNFWNVLSESCCLYLPQQDEQQQQQQQQQHLHSLGGSVCCQEHFCTGTSNPFIFSFIKTRIWRITTSSLMISPTNCFRYGLRWYRNSAYHHGSVATATTNPPLPKTRVAQCNSIRDLPESNNNYNQKGHPFSFLMLLSECQQWY